MMKLPLGFRFQPTPDEIHKYLYNKIHAVEEPDVNLELIPELDVYQVHPSDLPGLSKKDYTYFFARRSTKKDSHVRNDRQTKDGKGYWCAAFKSSKGTQQLIKRTLVYCNKAANAKGRGQKTNWVMHEYALEAADEKVWGNNNMILCGIYLRGQKIEDKETAQKEEEIESGEENQQKNADGDTKEENCLNLIKTIDHQSCYQQENITSTEETNLNLTLEL